MLPGPNVVIMRFICEPTSMPTRYAKPWQLARVRHASRASWSPTICDNVVKRLSAVPHVAPHDMYMGAMALRLHGGAVVVVVVVVVTVPVGELNACVDPMLMSDGCDGPGPRKTIRLRGCVLCG